MTMDKFGLTKEENKGVQDFLYIASGGEVREIQKGFGLCYSLGRIIADPTNPFWYWLEEKFKEWPEYSGNDIYPVPAKGMKNILKSEGEEYNTAQAAYDHYLVHDKHMYKGRYGAARRRLAEFILEKMVELE